MKKLIFVNLRQGSVNTNSEGRFCFLAIMTAPTPLTAKSRAAEELWRKFLEESKGQVDDDMNAYKCPFGKESFVEVTELSDMLKFEKHAAHVMLWSPAKDTDMMVDKYPLKYRITVRNTKALQ